MTWTSQGWVDEDVAAQAPAWLQPVIALTRDVHVDALTPFAPEPGVGRHSAVLVLFGERDGTPDIVIIRRSEGTRSHAGQPAFPGGAVETTDASAVAAALREAQEEAGVDPASVAVLGALPDVWVSVSNYVVTPVLGWWRAPHPLAVRDHDEVHSVHRITIDALTDPQHRVRVRHPSGYVGNGFVVDDLLIWGFTAGILSTLFEQVGWAKPWDPSRIVELT